jgi:5-methylcytosine-specific restriction endonuclease McrA
MHTARVVGRFPEVLGLLETGEVNLSTIDLVSGILTEENRKEVLAQIRGKTQREVEALVAATQGPEVPKDRVRVVRVAVPAGEKTAGDVSGVGELSQNRCNSLILHHRCGCAAGFARGLSLSSTQPQPLRQVTSQAPPLPPSSPPLRLESRFELQFVATEAFMKKLEKARALLSNRLDGMTLERVFEALMDEFLERHSPEKKQERREKRSEKSSERNSEKRREKSREEGSEERSQKSPDNSPRETSEKSPRKSSQTIQRPARPRERASNERDDGPIPEAIRDAVYQRDGGRCTYVGTTGQRCGSTHHLQVDHVVPRGRGGTNALANVRLLCGKHNRLEAERIYGANAIRQYRQRE